MPFQRTRVARFARSGSPLNGYPLGGGKRPIAVLAAIPMVALSCSYATPACTNPVPPVLRTSVGLQTPEDFWKTHQKGSVKLEALVEPDGHVSHVRVIDSSGPDYSRIAVESVSQWQYSPATCDGVPTPLPLVVNIAFSRDEK